MDLSKLSMEELERRIAEEKYFIDLEESKTDYSRYVEFVHEGIYRHGRHTRLICEKLMEIEAGEIDRLMIFLPPRHSKSMTVTETFPSWFIGRDKNRRVIEVSYGDDLAVQFGFANKQKVENCGSIFGMEIADGNEAKANWGIKGARGGMISVGIGGPITGKGADLLLIDDPHKNAEEAESETQRNKIWNEYQKTLLTRLQPGGKIILIMTRWHEDDLAGRILKNEDGWTIINLPCIAEENDLLGREIGEPLWPEFGFDNKWAEKKKRDVGSRTWNALYQQRPSSAEGDLLKRSWWKYYSALPQMVTKLISVDATFKDKETSDFVCIQVWGKAGPNMYLIDLVNARMDFPTTLQAIISMKAKRPDARQILIEDKANGSAIIQVLRTKIGGIIAVEPQGGKVARVNAISPHIESGNVYLPQFAPWTHDFVEQCATFPNGKYDDMVDAMSQALARLIYMPAALPQGPQPRDDFGLNSTNDQFSMELNPSYINYGCGRLI